MPSLYEILDNGAAYRARKQTEKIDTAAIEPYKKALAESSVSQLFNGIAGMTAGVFTAPSNIANLLDPHRAAAAQRGEIDNSLEYKVLDEINKDGIKNRELRTHGGQYGSVEQNGENLAQLIMYGAPTARLGSLGNMSKAVGMMPKLAGLAKDTAYNTATFAGGDFALSKLFGESNEVAQQNAMLAGAVGAIGTPIVGAGYGIRDLIKPKLGAYAHTPAAPQQVGSAPVKSNYTGLYETENVGFDIPLADRAKGYAKGAVGSVQEVAEKAKAKVRNYFDNEPIQNADGSFEADFESRDVLKSNLRTVYGYSQQAADDLSSVATRVKKFVKDEIIDSEFGKAIFDTVRSFKDDVAKNVDSETKGIMHGGYGEEEGFVRTSSSIPARHSAQRVAKAQIQAITDKIKILADDTTGEAWLKEIENQNTILFDATDHVEGSMKTGDRVKFTDEEASVLMNQEYMATLKTLIEEDHPVAQMMKDEILKELKNQLKEHRITRDGRTIEAMAGTRAEPVELTKQELAMKALKSRKKYAKTNDKANAAAEQAAKDATDKYKGRADKVLHPEKEPTFVINGLSEKGRTFRDSLSPENQVKYDRMKAIHDNIKLAENKIGSLSKDVQGKQKYEIQEMRKEAKALEQEIRASRSGKETPKTSPTQEPKAPVKEVKTKSKEPSVLDKPLKTYSVTLKDIAESSEYVGSNHVGSEGIHPSDVFDEPKTLELRDGQPKEIKGYYDPEMNQSHVRGEVDSIGSLVYGENGMKTVYAHESLHKYINKYVDEEVMTEAGIAFNKIPDNAINTSSHRTLYDGIPNNKLMEEEIVYYVSNKAILADAKRTGSKLPKHIAEDVKAFEAKILGKDKTIDGLVKKIDDVLQSALKDDKTFIHKAFYGDPSKLTQAFKKIRDADSVIAKHLPDATVGERTGKSVIDDFLEPIRDSDKADALIKMNKQKVKVERESVQTGEAIRNEIFRLVPDENTRVDITKHLLRTDFPSIREITSEASAKTAMKALDKELVGLVKDKLPLIKSMEKLMAEGMAGNLKALNHPNMMTNALAIAKRLGLEENQRIVDIIDKQVSLIAVSNSGGWKFIEKASKEPWFDDILNSIVTKNEFGSEVMGKNPLNYRKGYFAEMYDSPYIFSKDETGKIIKKLDTDLVYKEGAVPMEAIGRPKGTKIYPLKDFMEKWTEGQKFGYAQKYEMGVILDTAGKIMKFRKSLMSEADKIASGRVDDFAHVMDKTISSSMRKMGLNSEVIPAIKSEIIDGTNELISMVPKDGFIEVSEKITKMLPFDLRDVIKYVDKDYEHLLLGNIEVGYHGKNEMLKLAQAMLKDTVVNFKENVVPKNPVSWMNAFMFNVSVGLQQGMSPKFMYRNMKEGIEAYGSMRDIMKELAVDSVMKKKTPAQIAKLKEALDSNLLYQLNKEGMTMTMLSDIAMHPAFSSRLTDRMTYDTMKTYFGKETADIAATVFKNIYLHPHSKTGQFASSMFTKIDVMGRYALAKNKMSAEGMTAAQAAKFANEVFGDFDTVLPVWTQYLQEFGAIPFAGWFYRVGAGLGKTAYNNPGKTIALFAGLYALQGESGKRTEGWNPLATVVNTPVDMALMSPYRNIQNFSVNSKVPQVYQKAYKADSPDDMITSNSFD